MSPADDDATPPGSNRVHDPLVMPFANVRHLGFRDKIRAARLAGFGQLSLHPHETRDTIKAGLRPADMLEIAAENDVAITRLDPLSNWNPRWLPTNMDASYIDDFDIGAAEFFELCEQLGIRYCSLNATFAEGIYTTDEVVGHYASTCDRAARYDVTCDLENLPMWGVKTLRQAWTVVATADRPNGGIVFDTLHYMRSGSTLDMLREIPGERVHCVQLNDGPLRLPAGVTLEENCFDRGWPGTGEFPLTEIVRTLAGMDALRQVSPEVFSPHNATRGAAEIAALSSGSLHALLDAANVAYVSLRPYDRVDEGYRKPPGRARERREDAVEAEQERQLADPPATWQEHWFDHRQLLRLCHHDEHCAVYADPDVRQAEAGWLPGFINVTWQYSKATYGDAFGPDPRIYSIHHAGRHGGGHAGYYVSPVHDYHNVSDCGLEDWREGNTLARELPAHEIGHSVESANNGCHGSPAYEIWGDSKWAEFYIYDLYTALGMDREAKDVYRRFTRNTDDFPRRRTRWFRDWFYPLWRDCGQADVMNRFFRELARHFPRDDGGTYTRRMNWGEYVHFTSGAAAADMSGQAARAFGWPREWARQLEHAREQFPGITY